MKQKEFNKWVVKPDEFNLDNVLIHLQVLDDGPFTLLDCLDE